LGFEKRCPPNRKKRSLSPIYALRRPPKGHISRKREGVTTKSSCNVGARTKKTLCTEKRRPGRHFNVIGGGKKKREKKTVTAPLVRFGNKGKTGRAQKIRQKPRGRRKV